MSLAPFKPFETVLTEIPSLSAISLIVTIIFCSPTIYEYQNYNEKIEPLQAIKPEISKKIVKWDVKNAQKVTAKNSKNDGNESKGTHFH